MNGKATPTLNQSIGEVGKKPAVSLNQIFDQLATKKPEPAKGTITKRSPETLPLEAIEMR